MEQTGSKGKNLNLTPRIIISLYLNVQFSIKESHGIQETGKYGPSKRKKKKSTETIL